MTIFLRFFKVRFLFIALDVISPIRVVGFVVGDVELAHDGRRQMCVVCFKNFRSGLLSRLLQQAAKIASKFE